MRPAPRHFALDHPAIAMLAEFLAIPSPPGREEKFAELVRNKIEKAGFAPFTDAAGNVLARIKGREPGKGKVVWAAHMDEIGLVVTKVRDDGTLLVDISGGIYTWKTGERVMDVVGDSETVKGVLSMGSIHSKKKKDFNPTWADTWIFTGLTRERLGQAGVRCGSSAVPASDSRGPVILGEGDDPVVGAWTFDDRIDVVNLLRFLGRVSNEGLVPVRDTVIAFTVHEEAGCHGAKYLAACERPELFIAVDGCPVLPGMDLALDGRPGVWSKDAVTHFDQRVVADFIRVGREAGIEVMPAVFDGAASDASLVYSTGGAPRVATVGHIRDNSHGFELARLSSIDNVLEVMLRFATTWG